MLRKFFKTAGKKPSAAIFVSGTGSNARKILDRISGNPDALWQPVAIVTDRPGLCRAQDLAKDYGLPFVELDIFEFYRAHGLDKISIATEDGRRIRGLWTAALREKILPYHPDFGILAGFIPMTNLTEDLPCLNVHPGDLSIVENGRRIFAGLHVKPMETAILRNCETMRSSVILARAFSNAGPADADNGPLLGISAPVTIDRLGFSQQDFEEALRLRQSEKKPVRSADPLSVAADLNLEKLKVLGDWVVFPQVIDDFAAGKFAMDDEVLTYCGQPVRTVEYSADKPPVMILS